MQQLSIFCLDCHLFISYVQLYKPNIIGQTLTNYLNIAEPVKTTLPIMLVVPAPVFSHQPKKRQKGLPM